MDKITEARLALLRHLSTEAKKRRITQDEICQKTGISRSNISRMLSGKGSISLDNYLKISDAIGFKLPSLH
jgi:transcriptional regulator with XRE-family HTH domain